MTVPKKRKPKASFTETGEETSWSKDKRRCEVVAQVLLENSKPEEAVDEKTLKMRIGLAMRRASIDTMLKRKQNQGK